MLEMFFEIIVLTGGKSQIAYRGICRRQRNSADTLQSRRALDGNELRKFPVDVVKDGFGASGA